MVFSLCRTTCTQTEKVGGYNKHNEDKVHKEEQAQHSVVTPMMPNCISFVKPQCTDPNMSLRNKLLAFFHLPVCCKMKKTILVFLLV